MLFLWVWLVLFWPGYLCLEYGLRVLNKTGFSPDTAAWYWIAGAICIYFFLLPSDESTDVSGTEEDGDLVRFVAQPPTGAVDEKRYIATKRVLKVPEADERIDVSFEEDATVTAKVISVINSSGGEHDPLYTVTLNVETLADWDRLKLGYEWTEE